MFHRLKYLPITSIHRYVWWLLSCYNPKIVRSFLNRWGTFLTAFTAVETHLMGIFCDTLLRKAIGCILFAITFDYGDKCWRKWTFFIKRFKSPLRETKTRYLIFILVLQSQNCHIVFFKGGLDTEGIWYDFLYVGFWYGNCDQIFSVVSIKMS